MSPRTGDPGPDGSPVGGDGLELLPATSADAAFWWANLDAVGTGVAALAGGALPNLLVLRGWLPNPGDATRVFTGWVGAEPVGGWILDETRREVGVWIAPPHRRSGFASRGIRLLTERLGETRGWTAIRARILRGNHRSEGLVRRLGFEFEGWERGLVRGRSVELGLWSAPLPLRNGCIAPLLSDRDPAERLTAGRLDDLVEAGDIDLHHTLFGRRTACESRPALRPTSRRSPSHH